MFSNQKKRRRGQAVGAYITTCVAHRTASSSVLYACMHVASEDITGFASCRMEEPQD